MPWASSSSSLLRVTPAQNSWSLCFSRSISSSPYGRTHVWRRRLPKLPPPVVPHFPQRVILADGSSFVHWTTSPRSTLQLTRDATNNPLWNPWLATGNSEELEGTSSGRLGRFRRRFEELGGTDMDTGQTSDETGSPSPQNGKST